MQDIHAATLRILSEAGIRLRQSEGRDILARAGARVDGGRVYLPPDLVEQAVTLCPPQVSIRGRGGTTAVLGDGSLHWHNAGGVSNIYDPVTGKRRPATLQDVRDATRLLDALDGASTITPLFTPRDVPGDIMSLAMYRNTLPHTTKPVRGPGVQTATEVRYLVRMASVVGQPRDVLGISISPISPLTFPDDAVAAIIEAARQKLPLSPLPSPILGATAPMSLTGALAQQNAEILASVVLAQLVSPGLPILYHGRLALMDHRTGFSVWGGVELGMASAATVRIGHSYGLPVNVYGLSTNAHTLDLQNGYERVLNAVLPAMAGADELSGIGQAEAGVTSSLAQIVCDDEIVAGIRRLRRGMTTDESSLAVDVIADVMAGPRNFLGERHTVRCLRAGEMIHPRLADWRPWAEWDRTGRETMAQRAQAEAKRLLAEHEVPPLTEDQERELDEVLQAARVELLLA